MLSEQQRSGSVKHTKTMLSIEQKLKVLDYAKENPKESCRTLSTKFSVGKTQITTILKNGTALRAEYATYRGNNPGSNKRARQGRYQEINEALYKWYSLARESLVSINGPMLQEEAAEIVKQLAKPEYAELKASSGCLEKWKNAHGISQRSIEGGSGEVRKCFRKCGFIPKVCKEIESNDQIDTEFEELVRRIDGDASSADYIDADDMVPFCREPIDLSNEEWRSRLQNEVLSTKTDENAEPVEKIVCVDSDSEEECVDAEPAQPKIMPLSKAIEMLDDLAEFAERRLQDESLVSSLNKVCSAMQNLRIQNFRQKRISDYFGTTPGVHS